MHDRNRFFCRSLAVVAIVGIALLRFVYLARFCPLDLAPDEAHYWDWSRHLDWSYYSKGPLVALLIRGSLELFGPLSIALTGSEMLAVRLPAVVCGMLLVASVYVLVVRSLHCDGTALCVTLTVLIYPVVAAGSTLMTIDAPFLALWGWALVTGHEAALRDRTWAWLATGALIAVGILAKYTMILWLPCFGLYLLATPALRSQLSRPRYWWMTAIAALGAVPILWWNAHHDWVTVFHTGGHVGANSARLIHPLGPIAFFATQFALLLGFWFIVWVRAAIRFFPFSHVPEAQRYLWCMSIPIVLFFAAFSLKNGGGEPNWPIPAYLAGVVLAAAWMVEQLRDGSIFHRRLLVGSWIGFAVLGLVGTIVVHEPVWFQPIFAAIAPKETPQRTMPIRSVDPTARLRGWRTLAVEVDKIREEFRAKEGKEPILAGASWTHPGELGFYCQGHPTVYGLGPAFNDRHSQYDLWHPNPLADADAFHGATFVIVGADLTTSSFAFDSVEPMRTVEYREGKHLISIWTVVIGHGFHGFEVLGKDGF